MTSIKLVIEFEIVFSIKLNVSTWQILFWNDVYIIADLLTLKVCQIQQKDKDLKKAKLHLQRIRIENKKLFDEKHRIRTSEIEEKKSDAIAWYLFEKSTFEEINFSMSQLFQNLYNYISKKNSHIVEIKRSSILKNIFGKSLEEVYDKKSADKIYDEIWERKRIERRNQSVKKKCF